MRSHLCPTRQPASCVLSQVGIKEADAGAEAFRPRRPLRLARPALGPVLVAFAVAFIWALPRGAFTAPSQQPSLSRGLGGARGSPVSLAGSYLQHPARGQEALRRSADEEVEAAPAEGVQWGSESQEETAGELEVDTDAPAPLFQELNVSDKTSPKGLRGAIVAIFNRNERAVDLVLINPRVKHTLLYGLASVPDNFHAAGVTLIRKRDRRLRLRVVQQYKLHAPDDTEVLKVPANANVTRLGRAIQNKFVDIIGNNLGKYVKLQFSGKEAATKALIAIENAAKGSYREFAFSIKFVKEDKKPSTPVKDVLDAAAEPSEAEPAAGGEGGDPQQQVSLLLTLMAA